MKKIRRILAILCVVLLIADVCAGNGLNALAEGAFGDGLLAQDEETAAVQDEDPAVTSGADVAEAADAYEDSGTAEAVQEETAAPEVTSGADVAEAAEPVQEETAETTETTETAGAAEAVREENVEPAQEETAASNAAMELAQELRAADGTLLATVTAQIPEGTFAAETSAVTMTVNGLSADTATHIENLIDKELEDAEEELASYVAYNIRFQVNGAETAPAKAITIRIQNSGLTLTDKTMAKVFSLDSKDVSTASDDVLTDIPQREIKAQELADAGQTTDNIDDYDLSDITLAADGQTADTIQLEGRTNTVYGVYVKAEPEEEEESLLEKIADGVKQIFTTEDDDEEEEELQTLTWKDSEVEITVTEVAKGAIPDGASLQVVPITKDDKETKDQYEEVEKQLAGKAEEENWELFGFLAYDITLVNEDGKKVEPDGDVKVTMNYKEAAISDETVEAVENSDTVESTSDLNITLVHLEENADGEVTQVVDMVADTDEEATIETNKNGEVEKAEFVTDSFSGYVLANYTDYSASPTAGRGDHEKDDHEKDDNNDKDNSEQECNIEYYNGNAIVYWDTMSYNTTSKKASANHSAYTHITSVELNSTDVVNADSGGRSSSWSNGTAMSTYFPSASISNDVSTTLEITPASGYYVTRIVVACTDKNSSTTPYSCNTFAAGNAFNEGYSFTSTGAIQVTVNASDFSHRSESGKYFILIQVAPIPSPLYVEYDYGDIVTHIGNGTHTAFDTANGWTSTGSGNAYGTGEVQTENTQYKYAYAAGLTDEQEAAAWRHTTNSITQAAAEQAAAAGYYFTGWKFTYYSTATTAENSNKSYNNYTYTFSNSIGEGNVAENTSLTLLTNVKLVAQWAPIELTVTKTVSGLPLSNSSTEHTYGLQVQKLTGTDEDGDQTWTTITPATVTGGTKANDGTISLKVTGNNSTSATLSGGITPGTYRVVETSGNDDLPISSTTYTCTTTCSDYVEVKYGSYSDLTLTVTNAYAEQYYEPVNFFLNLDSKILDTSGNVSGQNVGNFTSSVSGILSGYYRDDQGYGVEINPNLVVKLPANHVHNGLLPVIGGEDPENALEVDTLIRNLGKSTGEKGTENGQTELTYWIVDKETGESAFPTDEEIFEYIRTYYSKYYTDTETKAQSVNQGPNKGKTLKVNGVDVDITYLTEKNFAIRWYVFKDQSGKKDANGDYIDCWHIDGILVAKTGTLNVTKTFPSEEVEKDILSQNLFEIEVTGNFLNPTKDGAGNITSTDSTIIKKLADGTRTLNEDGTVTYTWAYTIWGDSYTIEEKNYDTSSTCEQKYTSTTWTYTSVSGEASNGNGTKSTVSTSRTWNDTSKTGATQTFAFTNNYSPKTANLDLKKVSENDTTKYVTGAVFRLTRRTETTAGEGNNATTTVTWESVTGTGENYDSIAVNSDVTEITGLAAGVYKLEETMAPTDYILLSEPIYFKVTAGVVTLCDENGNALSTTYTLENNMWALSTGGTDTIIYLLTIKNAVSYSLPSTGGIGIYWYMIGGVMLMVAGVLILYKKRNKGVLRI